MEEYVLSNEAEVVFETPDSHSHFFGYYDRTPFDRSGNRLLAHRVPFDGRQVTAEDSAEVGYWEIETANFVPLGETRAFNWQQGSMLQWLPPDFDREVIYNDRGDDGFRSVIVDTETGEETVLPAPIYAVHPSGEYALTVNFERLVFCRPGYSYRGVRRDKWDVPLHDEDGIFRVDLDTGATERVLGTREVCEVDWRPTFAEHDNWLEHMLWNPSGTRFAFLHRWKAPDGGFRTRLFTANPDGSDLFMFPDTEVYSHLDWRDDGRFTVWARKPSSYQKTESLVRNTPVLNSVVRPVYDFLRDRLGDSPMDRVVPSSSYLQYDDKSEDFDVLAPDVLTRDGHFSWTTDGRWLLTDTYPDDEGYQHLLLYDDRAGELHEIGRFFATSGRTAYKCDLHPRWDCDEDRIVVDTDHDGRRKMVVINQQVTS